MRALAVVSFLFVIALLAVPVPAQVAVDAPTTVSVRVHPVDGEHGPGEKFTTSVTVEYCYFMSAAFAREPTTVKLEIAEAPDWAAARFDPAEVAFDLEPAASNSACAEPANVTLEIVLASNAPADEPAKLRVKAVAEENPPAAASEGEDEFLVTASGGFSGGDDPATRANATDGPPAADTPFPTAFAVVGVTLGVAVAVVAPARKK